MKIYFILFFTALVVYFIPVNGGAEVISQEQAVEIKEVAERSIKLPLDDKNIYFDSEDGSVTLVFIFDNELAKYFIDSVEFCGEKFFGECSYEKIICIKKGGKFVPWKKSRKKGKEGHFLARNKFKTLAAWCLRKYKLKIRINFWKEIEVTLYPEEFYRYNDYFLGGFIKEEELEAIGKIEAEVKKILGY